MPVHLHDLGALQKRRPEVYQELVKRAFTVRKSCRSFSAIAIDQAHEQNNALVKGDGGAIGLTKSPEALRRWMVSGPEIARIVGEFEVSVNEREMSEHQDHHESSKSQQLKFCKEVSSLVAVFEEMGNPFLEESNDLLALDTRDIADEKVIKTVKEIEDLGKCQFNNFTTERLVKREKSLFDPIRKNKLALFKRLFISCQTRNENLDEFFKHENQACPPSVSQNGMLRLPTKKSDLIDCISTSTVQSPSVEAIVLDGAAIINMLKPTAVGVKTFEDYSNITFIPYLKTQLQYVNRLDIVFDEYISNSLKQTTRNRRGKGVRRRVQSTTVVPKNWSEFLRNDLNKKELFYFLADRIPMVNFGDGKVVIITKGEQVLSSPPLDDVSFVAPCNHDEADTRILLHVLDATQSGFTKVGVRTVDTDVIAIGIGAFESIEGIEEFWVFFGTGVNRRVFAIHEIVSSLGSNRSGALPMFHAFTGCDTVSSFLGKGKKSAWQTSIHYDDVTTAFLACSSTSEESQEWIDDL